MNSQRTDTTKRRVILFNIQQHNGGVIIGAQGQETPITEVMIRCAYYELDRPLERGQEQT